MSEPRQRKELTRAYPLVLENKARSKKDPKGSFKDQGSGKTSGTQKSREYFHQKKEAYSGAHQGQGRGHSLETRTVDKTKVMDGTGPLIPPHYHHARSPVQDQVCTTHRRACHKLQAPSVSGVFLLRTVGGQSVTFARRIRQSRSQS